MARQTRQNLCTTNDFPTMFAHSVVTYQLNRITRAVARLWQQFASRKLPQPGNNEDTYTKGATRARKPVTCIITARL